MGQIWFCLTAAFGTQVAGWSAQPQVAVQPHLAAPP